MHFELSPTLENLQLSEATSQDVFVACLLQQRSLISDRSSWILLKKSINERKAKSHLLSPNHFHLRLRVFETKAIEMNGWYQPSTA